MNDDQTNNANSDDSAPKDFSNEPLHPEGEQQSSSIPEAEQNPNPNPEQSFEPQPPSDINAPSDDGIAIAPESPANQGDATDDDAAANDGNIVQSDQPAQAPAPSPQEPDQAMPTQTPQPVAPQPPQPTDLSAATNPEANTTLPPQNITPPAASGDQPAEQSAQPMQQQPNPATQQPVQPDPTQPMQSAQQPQPNQPIQPNQPPGTTPAQPTLPKDKISKNKIIIIVAAAAVAVALIIVGLWFFLLRQPSPESVFRSSLENSLSTQQYQIKATDAAATDEASETDAKIDLSNTAKPKMLVKQNSSDGVSGLTMTRELYATNDTTYTKITDIKSSQSTQDRTAKIFSKYLSGKWFKVDDSSAGFLTNQFLFNMLYVIGNFPDEERAMLIDYIQENEVYKYSPDKVTKEEFDGEAVYKYKVTLNGNKFVDLNEKIAKTYDISTDDVAFQRIKDSVEGSEPKTVSLYININSKRLVKAEFQTSDGKDRITKYSNYNNVSLPSKPTTSKTMEQALKQAMQDEASKLQSS